MVGGQHLKAARSCLDILIFVAIGQADSRLDGVVDGVYRCRPHAGKGAAQAGSTASRTCCRDADREGNSLVLVSHEAVAVTCIIGREHDGLSCYTRIGIVCNQPDMVLVHLDHEVCPAVLEPADLFARAASIDVHHAVACLESMVIKVDGTIGVAVADVNICLGKVKRLIHLRD